MTIPLMLLMLLMLGASLARLHAGTGTRAVLLSAWRIGAGAAIGVAIATAFGLEGSARAVLILQYAMPPRRLQLPVRPAMEQSAGRSGERYRCRDSYLNTHSTDSVVLFDKLTGGHEMKIPVMLIDEIVNSA